MDVVKRSRLNAFWDLRILKAHPLCWVVTAAIIIAVLVSVVH